MTEPNLDNLLDEVSLDFLEENGSNKGASVHKSEEGNKSKNDIQANSKAKEESKVEETNPIPKPAREEEDKKEKTDDTTNLSCLDQEEDVKKEKKKAKKKKKKKETEEKDSKEEDQKEEKEKPILADVDQSDDAVTEDKPKKKAKKNNKKKDQPEEEEIVEDKPKKKKKKSETEGNEPEEEEIVEDKPKKKKKKSETNENIAEEEEIVENKPKKKGKKKSETNENETEEEKTKNKAKKKPKDEALIEAGPNKPKKIKKKGGDGKEKKTRDVPKLEGDPKEVIFNYMLTQNRPYSAINVYDNLRGAIKKNQVIRILDELTEEGKLICKEYNSKIYMANQNNFPEVTEEQLAAEDRRTEELRAEIARKKEILAGKKAELNAILSEFTDEELKKEIEIQRAIVEKIKEKVRKIQANEIEPVPEEKMNEAKKNRDALKKKYKKLKRIIMDLISQFAEGMEISEEAVMEQIGIEGDEEIYQQYGIPKDYFK